MICTGFVDILHSWMMLNYSILRIHVLRWLRPCSRKLWTIKMTPFYAHADLLVCWLFRRQIKRRSLYPAQGHENHLKAALRSSASSFFCSSFNLLFLVPAVTFSAFAPLYTQKHKTTQKLLRQQQNIS